MGEVIDLPRKDQHTAGKAFCVQCGHEWVAVAPTGTIELECPSCHTMKGLYKYPCNLEEGLIWFCKCGCDLFRITEKGTLCYKCGIHQIF